MSSVVGLELEKALLTALHRHDLSLLPATLYVGLATGSLPLKTATLPSLPEVVGPGYGRWSLPNDATNFPALALAEDWKATSVTHRYANTGPADWTAADYVFLTDVASGTSGRFLGAATITPFLLRQYDTFDLTWESVAIP